MSDVTLSTGTVSVPPVSVEPKVPQKVGSDLTSKVKQFHDDALRELKFKH